MKAKALIKYLLVTSVFIAPGMTAVFAMDEQNPAEQNVLPPPGPYLSLPEPSQLNAPKQNGLTMHRPMMPHPSFHQQPRTSYVPAWQRYSQAPHQSQQQSGYRPEWKRTRPPEPQWRYTPPPRPEWAQRAPQAPYRNPLARPQRNNQVSQKNTDVDGNANTSNIPQYQAVPRRPDWAMRPSPPPQRYNRPPRPEWAQRPPQMRSWNPQARPQMRPQWSKPASVDSAKNNQAIQQNTNVDSDRVQRHWAAPQRPDWAIQSRVPYQRHHGPTTRPELAQNQSQSDASSAEQLQPQTGVVNRHAIPDARGRIYGPPGYPAPVYGYPPVR